MIRATKYKISSAERVLLGRQIIAQQPEITFAEALAQVQRLKQISTVASSSKKSRPKI